MFNSDLVWASGAAIATVPYLDWTDLLIEVLINNSNERIIPISFVRGEIGQNEYRALRSGYYAPGNSAYANVGIRTNSDMQVSVALGQALFNDEDVTATSSIRVVYRRWIKVYAL